ncbi:MAG: phosphate ABC transporter permease subunit PstC [Pseudomonadota bacterium]
MRHSSSHIKFKRFLDGDDFFKFIIRGLAILLVILFVFLLVYLIRLSLPNIKHSGFSFLWSQNWSPAQNQFGALPAIIGTLVTAIISIIIAVPISIGSAVLITHMLVKHRKTARVIARLIELLAGIPSIIYGMWGLFFLVPFLQTHIQPGLINRFGSVPVLKFFLGGLPLGIGIFTAGLVLAIMIIPLISSMMRDIISSVPKELIESTYSIGATRWEVIRHVVIPYIRAGLLGSVILGFGRALGETMAVTFVIGNSHQLFTALFMPGTTISATIANEFTEATGHIYPAALIELGLILFVITFIIISLSRYLLHHTKIKGRI